MNNNTIVSIPLLINNCVYSVNNEKLIIHPIGITYFLTIQLIFSDLLLSTNN